MSRVILAPVDISDKELIEHIISHVESEVRIDDAEVHFLSVIPSLPYYTSPEMACTVELPGMGELREGTETQLKEIAKQFSIPEDRTYFHVAEGSPRDKILALTKSLPANLVIIASHQPDITTCLLGSNAIAVARHTECSVLVVR